jgi:hypothetical protein
LKNDLLKLDPVKTYTDLADCVKIVTASTLTGSMILPVFGSIFAAAFSESECSKEAQEVMRIHRKLLNINEYKKIGNNVEFPKEYKNFCKRSFFGNITGISEVNMNITR